jgi:hypothetical protein
VTENPYAPPSSRVEDLAFPEVRGERPRQVVFAVRLAAVNYVLGLLSILVSWEYFSKLQSPGAILANQLFSVALLIWIYYKIYHGRNWARIVLLVFSVLGALLILSSAVMSLLAAAPFIAKAQMVIGIAVNLIILWLLFISPGRHWFRRIAARPAA